MKRICFLFAALFCILGLDAQTLPMFSTLNDTTWYHIRFKVGENVLRDAGEGAKLVTATFDDDNKEQQFALIGTRDSFRLLSRVGNYVSYNTTTARFTSSTSGVQFKLVSSTAPSAAEYWEIQRKDSNLSMNQFGGPEVGVQLGEWRAGDVNNSLSFEAVAPDMPPVVPTPVLPTFSNGSIATWYFIQFKNSTLTIEAQALGAEMKLAKPSPKFSQMWRLVGTRDNFQLINKNGHYAAVNPQGFLITQTTQPSYAFKLIATSHAASVPAWEIQRTNVEGSSFNQWQWAVAGSKIGFWHANDKNNPVVFIEKDNTSFADYKVSGATSYQPKNKLTLWYDLPTTLSSSKSGDLWMEYALPIGNGQFGAMVYGGIAKEEIQFNEKTLWSGKSTDNGTEYGCYQNFGSVFIENIDNESLSYADAKGVQEYYRNLDLTTATANVSFQSAYQGVTYTRQYIASYPDRVVAMHLTASEKGKQSVRISMESGKPGVSAVTSYVDGEATFAGKLQTVSYSARLKVLPTGGTMTTSAKGIEVRNADEILIILGGGTNFDAYSDDFVSGAAALSSTISSRVKLAGDKGWKQLYADHLDDYKSLFDRVDFQLAGSDNSIPTNRLIDDYSKHKGTTEPSALMLEQLYYNYGRYLTIAASRGVDLPSNLQGIWNNSSTPAWNSDIHANINVQMNYWPTEANNMSEMHLPFLNYITNMAMNHTQWRDYAVDSGQTKGWTLYTENNIFGGVGAFLHKYVIANAWFCTHLWQHYRYTMDKVFLKKVFPTMWSATEYWMERLKKASDGTYECPNEYSPEQGPTQNGVAHAQQLVWELFSNTKQAIEVLKGESGVSGSDIDRLNERLDNLDRGLAIEKYTGFWGSSVNGVTSGEDILREWKYSNYTVGNNEHRHLSHLMCLYPFSQVQAGDRFFEAAVNSLRLRGDESTGWSMGWKINLWARALDGNYAHKILESALQHCSKTRSGGGVFYNLFDVHPNFKFQIDGNYGTSAGISEMLLQSQTDTLHLLPALPSVWVQGHVNGLKAVGNFTVDLSWNYGVAESAKIVSHKGMPLVIKYPGITSVQVMLNGAEIEPDLIGKDIIKVPTNEGDILQINFTKKPNETAIDTIDSEDFLLTTQGRSIVVEGEVHHISVADMLGRIVLQTAHSLFTLPSSLGNVFVVTIQNKDGKEITQKIILK